MKKFDTSFRGYDKKQVNSFVGDVADKYESMLNNLKSRDQQIQELQNKLEYYKKMEEIEQYLLLKILLIKLRNMLKKNQLI